MASRRHGVRRPRALTRVGTFRARMIRILALSLVCALVPLGFLVAADVHGYSAALETSRAVTTEQNIQALIHELQKERGLSVGLLGGDERFRGQLAGQRRLTDSARAALDAQLNNGLPGAATVRAALPSLASLAATRTAVDHGTLNRAGALQYYTDAIAALASLSVGADAATDPMLRDVLATLTALGAAKGYT